jgi:hypothetical protein
VKAPLFRVVYAFNTGRGLKSAPEAIANNAK